MESMESVSNVLVMSAPKNHFLSISHENKIRFLIYFFKLKEHRKILICFNFFSFILLEMR